MKKFVFYAKDLFDKPSNANLKNKKRLDDSGDFLQKSKFHLVVVTAYTGFNGEKQKNLELSQAQATVVRQYLVDHFKINDTQIKTKGMGEDEQGDRDQVGRVEVIVYG